MPNIKFLEQNSDRRFSANCSYSEFLNFVKEGNLGALDKDYYSDEHFKVIDDEGKAALHWAVERGHVEMAERLVQEGAILEAVDKEGYSALHLAAFNARQKAIDMLLKKGANINVKDKDGRTPLHRASSNGHLVIVKQLHGYQLNIDVIAEGDNCYTPLHKAVLNGYEEIARFLLTAGANQEAYTNDVKTSLHCAVFNGRENLVALLLENHCRINAQDKKGWTPLHWAVFSSRENIDKFLLIVGASKNLTDNRMPLQLAVDSGKKEIAQIIQNFVAKRNSKDAASSQAARAGSINQGSQNVSSFWSNDVLKEPQGKNISVIFTPNPSALIT